MIGEQDMTDIDLQEVMKSQTVVIDRKVYKDHPILQGALNANVIVAQRIQRL